MFDAIPSCLIFANLHIYVYLLVLATSLSMQDHVMVLIGLKKANEWQNMG